MPTSPPARCAWLLLLLFSNPTGRTQAQNDPATVYDRIERYADKRKATRWIYDAMFVAPISDEEPVAAKVPRRRVDPNLRYKGRIIRSIRVHVFDPFGYSVDDTTQAPTNLLQQGGNRLHRRTRDRVVRNLLLIHALEALDPMKITESERILRASPMITDAAVRVAPLAGSKDSVDVVVLVHDNWSIDVSAEGDLGSISATGRDRNLLGWGQELEQRVVYVNGASQPELQGHHSIHNIKRSHITSTLYYSTSAEVDRLGSALARPFYSPLVHWAGGVSLDKSWGNDKRTDPATGITSTYRLSPVSLDTWLARSFTLGDGVTIADRSSSITVGARYAQTRYAARTPLEVDTARTFTNSSLLLASAGFGVRQYYEERYLYRFGSTEDVPEGLLCTMTAGVFKREQTVTAPYVGLEVSAGRNTDRLGYLSLALAYGTFFRLGDVVDATWRVQLTYFTDLYNIGRWHMRQFARINSTIGFNKPITASLSLGGDQLYGLPSEGAAGVHKTVLNLETVAYAPYALLGFRFAPVLLIGFGNIGDESDPLLSGRIYTAFSLGLLVRNENLLVKTFEISVGFYPYLPDGSTAAFQVNPSTSFSLRARDFAFSEPAIVAF